MRIVRSRDAVAKLPQNVLALVVAGGGEVALGSLEGRMAHRCCRNVHGGEGPLQVGAPGAVGAHDGDGVGTCAAGQLLGNGASDKGHLASQVGSRFPCAFKGAEGRFQRHALQGRVGRFEFREAGGTGVGLEGGQGGLLASGHGDLARSQQVYESLGSATHEQVIVGQHDGRAEALAQRRFGFQSAHGQDHGFAR